MAVAVVEAAERTMAHTPHTNPSGHPPSVEELAALSFDLLRDGVDWVSRRKEAMTILDDQTLRRRESVDVDLARLTPTTQTQAGDPVYYVPLFFLRKAPHQFSNFDLIASGSPLALPTRTENAAISSHLLRLTCRSALHKSSLAATSAPSGLDPRCDRFLDALATDAQDDDVEDLALAFYDAITAAHGQQHTDVLRADETFPWMFALLAKSSAVVLRLAGEEPPRRIVKISYDETLVDVADTPGERLTMRLGWDGYPLIIDLPFIGAQNYHFQADAPAGMQFVAAGLLGRGPEPSGEVRDDAASSRRVHLYLSGTDKNRAALAWLIFRLRGEGFIGGAFLGAVLVALVLTLFAASAHLIARNPTSAPSLLLAVTGILASYVVRPGQHALTARLLSTVRLLVLVSGGLAYAAAATIAINPGKISVWVLRPVWTLLATIAWLIVLVLWFSWRLPRAPGTPISRGERSMRSMLAMPPQGRLGLNVSRVPHPAADPPTLLDRLRPHLTKESRSRFWLRVKQTLRWGDHRPPD